MSSTPSALGTLLAENERLREHVTTLANELEAVVEHHYRYTKSHPAMADRYDRDMEPVRAARSALEDSCGT